MAPAAKDPNPGNDTRTFDRMKWIFKADVISPFTKRVVSQAGLVLNVSPSGLSILTEDHLPLGTSYLFQIPLNIAESIQVHGKIVQAKVEGLFQTSGVQFEAQTFSGRVKLNRFMTTHSATLKRYFQKRALLVGLVLFFLNMKIFGISFLTSLILSVGAIFLLLIVPY